jgi:hypothetical protein
MGSDTSALSFRYHVSMHLHFLSRKHVCSFTCNSSDCPASLSFLVTFAQLFHMGQVVPPTCQEDASIVQLPTFG